jgi:hypothetical protein
MSWWLSRAGAVLVAVAGAAALAVLSAYPLPGDAPQHALLRLDWRLRGEEAGDCLRPRAEDLARLPLHMQNPDACVGSLPPYRLRLWIDDVSYLDEIVTGGGAREDRPLTVYRDMPLEPGRRRIRAAFVREALSDADATDGARQPTTLHVDAEVLAEAGRVLLVVRRQDTGDLVVRSPVP